MKIVKGIFLSIAALVTVGCLGILICALTPSLTNMLAEKVGNAQAAPSVDGGILNDNRPRPGINAGWMEGGDGYLRPESLPSGTPSSVDGRTGYEPVQENGEQIGQGEAENLSGIISPGETGNEFSFDREKYPYYAMLEQSIRPLYHQIYANALKLTVSFTPAVNVSVEQLKTVFEAVYGDHPELFWLEGGYNCRYLRSGSCVEVTLKYNETADRLEDAKREFEAAAQRILTGAQGQDGDGAKERYVHDALTQTVEYDAAAPMNQSAYSALVGGRTVCAGYARAFQYLMQQLGIPCYYCTGYAGEDHAWNIVKVDGFYRNVDVTWDDTDPATYDYYNKSDAYFGDTHVRTGLSVYLPACLGDDSDAANQEPTPDPSWADLINPNPVEPLEWQSKSAADEGDRGLTAEEQKRINLEKAGITEDQVRETVAEYYEDCLKLLKEAGKGDKQFVNIVPEMLWNALEQGYGRGDFRKGYADEALKALGAEDLVIQIQVQRLGGGYYRLYHNVYTY